MSDKPIKIRIWDLPIRIFHWSIVLLMGLSWWSVEEGNMELHQWSGLAVLALVLTRILWGIYGSATARFSSFITGPVRLLEYMSHMFKLKVPAVPGHTPTGGWMIVILLTLLLVQPALGLFATDDIFYQAPLYYLVSQDLSYTLTGLHKSLFDIILVAALLHVLAVLFYQFILKDRIISPMITGWREWSGALPKPLTFVNPIWAIVTLAVIAGLIYQFILKV